MATAPLPRKMAPATEAEQHDLARGNTHLPPATTATIPQLPPRKRRMATADPAALAPATAATAESVAENGREDSVSYAERTDELSGPDVLRSTGDLMRERRNVGGAAGWGTVVDMTQEQPWSPTADDGTPAEEEEYYEWCLVFQNTAQQNANRRHMEKGLDACKLHHAQSLTKSGKFIYVRVRASSDEQLYDEADRIQLIRRLSPLQQDDEVFVESRHLRVPWGKAKLFATKPGSAVAKRQEEFERVVRVFKTSEDHHHDSDIGCAPFMKKYMHFFDCNFKSGTRQRLVRSIFERELSFWVQDVTADTNARPMSILDLPDTKVRPG